jgi:hypothetical protein
MTPPDPLDYDALARLRAIFLQGNTHGGDYWDRPELLPAYHATFGERIGWKWDCVLAELRRRKWAPPAGLTLVDWGCGTGVAALRLIEAHGAAPFSRVVLSDRSPTAVEFAGRQVRALAPALAVETVVGAPPVPKEPFALAVSHVLVELDPVARAQLLRFAEAAEIVWWVEPGTAEASRMLVTVREALRPTHGIIAPCTHAHECGLLQPGNEGHWCHHFGFPPTIAFTEKSWGQFFRTMGIDARSLPYAFLVLDRRRAQQPSAPAVARLIGRPREYKGFARTLVCDENGVRDREVQKRDDRAFFRSLGKRREALLYRLDLAGERIGRAQPWPDDD